MVIGSVDGHCHTPNMSGYALACEATMAAQTQSSGSALGRSATSAAVDDGCADRVIVRSGGTRVT